MTDQNSAENSTLVMDWGNTVMQVFPEYSGTMASWPEVARVDGVLEALTVLRDTHKIVIATNAGDSKTEDVWAALRRVGLEEYFQAIFTSNELGSKKPDQRFFQQLESVLNRPTRQLVMIGDDFNADILGAKAAGWRAVWYNPSRRATPGLLPLQDAEIADLRDLPAALNHLTLPDYTTCLAWLLERGASHNVLAHIQLVASVAYQLAAWLRMRGESVDCVLTHRGAMLHDLCKVESIRQWKEQGIDSDHAQMACDVLNARAQPELAEIALRHALHLDPTDARKPVTWEQKLVHYADKLSEGSRLVMLEERIAALKGRYTQYSESIEASAPELLTLQDEICEHAGISPQQINDQLRAALY